MQGVPGPSEPKSGAMTVTGIRKPAAHAARPASSAARLAWLHLRSRRALAALTALLACSVALWASLHYHWWLGTGNAADELPMILQGCAAGIIAVTTHSPFGEPERATGWRLPVLRAGLALALCGAAIAFFALGAAVAYSPRSGIYLVGGILPVARNVLGMTGIGLILCMVTGALIAWTGPLAFTAISQFALIANYSEPLTWPTRPPADRGGWMAAMVVFAAGLLAFTVGGPRIRQSGELRPAVGQRCPVSPKLADKYNTRRPRLIRARVGRSHDETPGQTRVEMSRGKEKLDVGLHGQRRNGCLRSLCRKILGTASRSYSAL